MKKLWRAWRFFSEDWPRLLVILGMLVASICANLLKPWPVALMVDSVFGQKPLPSWLSTWAVPSDQGWMIAVLALLVLLLHASHGTISAAQNYVAIGVGLRGLRRVRDAVFSRLQRLSLRFHHGAPSGDTIYRATWDPFSFQTLFQQGLITFCTAGLSLAMMLVVMWRLNHRLTLVALALVPLLLVVIRVFARQMRERGVLAQQADSQVTNLVQQAIVTLPLVQSYVFEEQEQRRFADQSALAQRRRLSQHGWELIYWLAISLIFAVGAAAILWVGSLEVTSRQLSIGHLLIFLAYLTQFYDPLNQLSHVGSTLSSAGAGIQRVFEILDAPEEVKDAPDARPVVCESAGGRGASETVASSSIPAQTRPLPSAPGPPSKGESLRLRGAIEFDKVTFGYEAERPVLRELSLWLPAGHSAAIVGPSGAGKTTLLQLLARFYDPASGAVRFDGADARSLRLRDLRRCVALVLQEPILLAGSIAENIACGNTSATREQIEAAGQAAHADSFIKPLPQGYDTIVGEGAARLSVGEKQRLNLARAFLKDAPILLLDEPTSALDAESERLVLDSLQHLMRGRTTVLVTHRLRTIDRLDRILVLGDGKVVEEGSPDEFKRKPDGYYARAMGLVKG